VRPDTGFDIHNLIESVLILATMGVSRYCLWLFVCLFVCLFGCLFVCLMVTNATFNNITVISWQSVLLVEETGCLRETQQSAASHWQTLSHNVVHLALMVIRTRLSVVVGTDCLGSCKSNYHTITPRRSPIALGIHDLIESILISATIQWWLFHYMYGIVVFWPNKPPYL
jgi:hypothetical protein